jgi:hypothetical protein
MGTEITFGRGLAAAGFVPAIEAIGGNGYLLKDNWHPTSTFMLASTGTNLFNTAVARMHTLEASLGRKTGGAVIFLGANDVVAGGTATSGYGTNMTAMFAALRTAFGATFPIALVRVSANEAITPADLATVRAAQASVVAADARSVLIDGDDLALLTDVLHFNANANLTLGDRAAYGLRALLGYSLPVPAAIPVVVGWGAAEFGSGNLSPTSFAGVRNGDLEIMPVINGINNASAVATPAGWTAIGSLTTSGATGIFVNFNVFARVVTTAMLSANSNHTAPTTVVAGDSNNLAQIFAFRGPSALTLANVDSFSLWPENAFANPKSIPSMNTLTANCGVLQFVFGWTSNTGRTQTLTNSTMTGFVQHLDGDDPLPSTQWFVSAAASGSKATAGAIGVTTDTTTGGNIIGGAITVAVKP